MIVYCIPDGRWPHQQALRGAKDDALTPFPNYTIPKLCDLNFCVRFAAAGGRPESNANTISFAIKQDPPREVPWISSSSSRNFGQTRVSEETVAVVS